MTTRTLYRATEEPGYFGAWSCWSESLAAAEAYTDNPGFGGPVVYQTRATIENVLHLRRGNEFRALAQALRPASEAQEASLDWAETYGYVWEAWEASPAIASDLEQRYDWVVYTDNYPEGAVTWCYIGSTPLGAMPVDAWA